MRGEGFGVDITWNASRPPAAISEAGPNAPSICPCKRGVRPVPHGAARRSEFGRCRFRENSATVPEMAKRDGPLSPCDWG